MDTSTIDPKLRQLLAATPLYTDGRTYAVVSLPRDQMRPATILFGGLADPFAAMIVDKDEITIIMHDMDWSLGSRGLAHMRVDSGYRLITFDAQLDLATVGYMAVISRLLADAGVAILPIAAYSRDHVMVHVRDFDRAWKTLTEFLAGCKE
jgi:hypothetical protein